MEKSVEQSTDNPQPVPKTKSFKQMTTEEIVQHSVLSGTRKAPNTDIQILVDSIAIITKLQEANYEPMEILFLISKMYGAVVGTMPNNMRDQTGAPLTVNDLETNFFYACKTERKIVKEKSTSGVFYSDVERILH